MLYDPKWEAPAEMKPLEPWRRALLDAADYLDRNGWCKNMLWDGQRACALGAIALVAPGCWEADARLRRHLGIPNIADWNNAPDRTKKDVTSAMRAAAKNPD